MASIWRDVRLALRGLRRAPGFAVVAIVTLALGIGAGLAMFSVLHSVALRPLPYRDADRLVRLWPAQNFNITLTDLVGAGMPGVEAVTGLSAWSYTLQGEGDPEQLQAAAVSTSHFEVLGVAPVLGRSFRPEERDPGRGDVVILSHGLWQRRFGGDPDIVGRTIRLEGIDHLTRQVIGVLPRDHRPLRGEPAAWVPLQLPSGRTLVTDSTWYVNYVVARLAPGVSVERADEEMRAVAARLRGAYPGLLDEEIVARARVEPLDQDIVGDVAGTLWLLLGAVGLVIIIVCANLANLLLARGVGRERDAAVRAALGASRGRLVRQHITEGLVLAALGTAVAVPLAAVTLTYLKSRVPAELPRTDAIGLDLAVFLFAIGLAGVTALVSSLAPALRFSGGRVQQRLRSGGRWSPGSARSHRLNRTLVATEVALAMILVTAGALVLSGFAKLRGTDPGFRPDGVTVVETVVPPGRARDSEALTTFYGQALERVAALPGVTEVGAIHLLPLTPDNWSFPYLAEGQEASPDQPLPAANFRVVAGDYFRAVGMRLIRGRTLDDGDRADAPSVGLINETLARTLWPHDDPIGKEIRIFGNIPFTVVGVVNDVKQHALDREPFPEMYVPQAQWRWRIGRMFIMARTPAAPPSARTLREAVWSVYPGVPIPSVQPLSRVIASSVADARFFASLLAGFGALALIIGMVGVYGVAAHLTGARLPDYGIRMALGARPRAVVRHALVDGLRPVGIGLAAGIAGAHLTSRLLVGLLYGVAPGDPTVYAAVASLLLAAALAATWFPARRAARVDPVDVLRVD